MDIQILEMDDIVDTQTLGWILVGILFCFIGYRFFDILVRSVRQWWDPDDKP